MFKLLAQVIVQQSVFELVNRLPCLLCQSVEPYPNQESTTDVVALHSGFAALTSLQSRHLFALAVQLLNFPAAATHLLCGRRRILSQIVGHNEIRAVGRHHDPETLHFVLFGKAFDFDALALR